MLKLKHKGLKIILLIVLIIVIISVISLIVVNNRINSIVEDRVYNNFNDTEYSKYYDLSFDNLHINVLNGTVKFSDVKFAPKKNVDTTFFYENGKYNIEVKDYILKGADIYRFIETDTLNVKLVKIIQPTVDIIRYIKDSTKQDNGRIITSPFVEVNKIEIVNANLSNSDLVNNSANKLSNISFTINRFKYNSDSVSRNIYFEDAEIITQDYNRTQLQNDILNFKSSKILLSDINICMRTDTLTYSYSNFTIGVDSIKTSTKNKFYDIILGKIDLNVKNSKISVNNFHVKPNFSRTAFAKKNKYQKELFNVQLNKIDIVNINLDSLIYSKSVIVDSIIFDGGTLDVYKDKTYPLDTNKFPLLLNQQILNIPIRTDVKNILASNIAVVYSEKTEDGHLGKVDLKVNTKIANISNINIDEPLILAAKGKIHNTAKFNVNVSFNYNVNGFSYDGSISAFDITDLNKVISSFMPIEAKRGDIHKVQFSGYASKSVSKGEMIFAYNHLKLKVLDEEGQKNVDKYTNSVLSLTANTLIQTNNPVSEKASLIPVKFIFYRDVNRGFFNYLWKSILSGLSETVMPAKTKVKNYKDDFVKWHNNIWSKKTKKKKE